MNLGPPRRLSTLRRTAENDCRAIKTDHRRRTVAATWRAGSPIAGGAQGAGSELGNRLIKLPILRLTPRHPDETPDANFLCRLCCHSRSLDRRSVVLPDHFNVS